MEKITVVSFEMKSGKWAVAVGCANEITVLSPLAAMAVAERLNGQDVLANLVSARDMETTSWLEKHAEFAIRPQVASALVNMATFAVSRNRAIAEGEANGKPNRNFETSQAH